MARDVLMPSSMQYPVVTPTFFDPDYLIGEVLGIGGMGVVYSAIQLSLRRRVAIKIPHPALANDAAVIRRFRCEADACGRLDHRNIARVIDFRGRDGTLYLVMEYVPGMALDKVVLEQGPMPTAVAADLCGQLLAGLHEAHVTGIIHADVKTANILIETLADKKSRAVLIDFGLARFSDDPYSHNALLLSGTPDYLAPELIRGDPPSAASDIYAAGVVLYELLTGLTPFGGGSSAEILARQIDDAAVPPSLRSPEQNISAAIEDVVMRALAKDPRARFETAALFGIALRAAASRPAAPSQAPRTAKGTQPNVLSAETRTVDLHRSERAPILRVAASVLGESGRIIKLRAVVAAAIASGDGDEIVTSYLELARALIDGRQMTSAAGELERGLALLRPDGTTQSPPSSTWRLQLCLAALYSGLGDPARAKAAAVVGQDDAVRAASIVGEDRARALLVRLNRTRTSS